MTAARYHQRGRIGRRYSDGRPAAYDAPLTREHVERRWRRIHGWLLACALGAAFWLIVWVVLRGLGPIVADLG